METLAASIRVARAALPRELISEEATGDLARFAEALAPIHCAGFETRLGPAPSGVDLIQRVRALGGEPLRLREHIERTGLSAAESWRRVGAFCEAWGIATSIAHRRVAGAFLEFDVGSGKYGEPSLYLSLEPGTAAHTDQFLEFVSYAGALLRGADLPEDLKAGVARCHRSLPDGADITDVGFMLSRDIEAVRLVAAPLLRHQLRPLLSALEWHGEPPDIAAAVKLVPDEIEHLALSLDIGARAFPRVGIEYYPGPFDADVPTWEIALDALVCAGLCTDAKRQALLRWPGHFEPTDCTEEWPASLLVASLLNRADQFIVLARRLTFLKLVCTPGNRPEAKAYFGYGPRSFAARTEDEAELPGAPPGDGRGAAISLAATARHDDDSNPREPPPARYERAITDAATYLMQHRGDDGMWREFPRILRGANEWVTAYIATVLAALPGLELLARDPVGSKELLEECHATAHEAWRLLDARRGPNDGWGYNSDLPQDADSTLWGLELADAIGEGGSPRAVAAREVLARHLLADGSVATYIAAAETGLRRLLGDADLRGMFAPHTCVTAAVARRDELAACVTPALARAQDDDGRWRGYWWSDDEYTTALAVEALSRTEGTEFDGRLSEARLWARARFDRSGAVWSRSLGAASPFATALCIDILSPSGQPHVDGDVAAALDWLLRAQHADGSWRPSALMRMPPPEATSGDAQPHATTVSVDDRALFTTATVTRTLAAVASAGRPR